MIFRLHIVHTRGAKKEGAIVIFTLIWCENKPKIILWCKSCPRFVRFTLAHRSGWTGCAGCPAAAARRGAPPRAQAPGGRLSARLSAALDTPGDHLSVFPALPIWNSLCSRRVAREQWSTGIDVVLCCRSGCPGEQNTVVGLPARTRSLGERLVTVRCSRIHAPPAKLPSSPAGCHHLATAARARAGRRGCRRRARHG